MAQLLLLDDDDATLAWMSAALESRGHSVVGFSNARAALEALQRTSPDLIIADILMPEMDGLNFARLVRDHRGIPVMFVSIVPKTADAVLAGAIGYVEKPATAQEVRAAVDRVLGRRTRRNLILVVDDDGDVCDLYRLYLQPRFDVVTAENGQQALDQIHRHPIDLVITDVVMPVMNGLEFIKALRAEPAYEHLPVLVQTGNRAAVEAPVWNALHVSHVMDKYEFIDWLTTQIDRTAAPGRR